MGTTGGLSAAAGCRGLDSLSVTLQISGGIGDSDGIEDGDVGDRVRKFSWVVM